MVWTCTDRTVTQAPLSIDIAHSEPPPDDTSTVNDSWHCRCRSAIDTQGALEPAARSGLALARPADRTAAGGDGARPHPAHV
eukprot:SAG31_NODE_1053_length_10144_cov_117.540866_6_plen_82_part_00